MYYFCTNKLNNQMQIKILDKIDFNGGIFWDRMFLMCLGVSTTALEFIKSISIPIKMDYSIVTLLFFLVVSDTITGIYKSFVQRNFNSYKLRKVLEKVLIYALVLFFTHFLAKLSGVPAVLHETLSIVDTACYSLISFTEALSIAENIEEIRPNTLPKFILKYLTVGRNRIEKTIEDKLDSVLEVKNETTHTETTTVTQTNVAKEDAI